MQTEILSPNWTDLCHGHEADRLHQSITWLHPDELVHHLARINGRRVLGGLPHGDSFHHDHLKQVGDGDLEKGRPVGVILRGPILTKIWPRETIFVEAITRSITKNHISVMIHIPHHPNTFRTITRLLDHPTHHRVVDGMVISPTHLSILRGVVTVPQVALLAIIIPILHGHRHTPLRPARCSSTLRGGATAVATEVAVFEVVGEVASRILIGTQAFLQEDTTTI